MLEIVLNQPVNAVLRFIRDFAATFLPPTTDQLLFRLN